MENKLEIVRYTGLSGEQTVLRDSLTEQVYSVDQYLRARKDGRKLNRDVNVGPSPISEVLSSLAEISIFEQLIAPYFGPSPSFIGMDIAHGQDTSVATEVEDGKVVGICAIPRS